MIDVFIPLKGFLRIEKIRIDNIIFRLHYRMTVVLLVISMLLVTSKQLFGDSIHCFGNDREVIYKEAINNFCWMYGTYTVAARVDGLAGKDFIYPGVGPDEGVEIFINYYQWVFVVLMLQAFMFYLPHYLWKIWESGRIKILTNNLDGPSVPDEWAAGRKAELVSYLTHSKIFAHNLYALRFAFCECLNLANVVFQIYLVNWFLGGNFLTYGSAVSAFSRRADPLADLSADPRSRCFPKMSKCRFLYYGASGGVQTKDLLCVLPINVINEKIYLVLWFWFIALALLSVVKVAQTALLFACASLRSLVLLGQVRFLRQGHVAKIVAHFSFGDWFVLHQLGENLNPVVYKELVLELSSQLDLRTFNM